QPGRHRGGHLPPRPKCGPGRAGPAAPVLTPLSLSLPPQIRPRYLQSCSTAALRRRGRAARKAPDNASHHSMTAKHCIDVLELTGHLCLTFMDNKTGMTPHRLYRTLKFSFGFMEKAVKSGSMRLGKDAIIFTKTGRQNGIFSWLKNMIVTEGSVPSLEAILEHTVFNTREELLAQFSAIPGKKGTHILIGNIRSTKVLHSQKMVPEFPGPEMEYSLQVS
uniref:Uncharacterized protein n=1 Tax=Aquila chrysaetos chrysaetos TaxID=223781 RepID=A0A663FD43_AQUCH